MTKLVLIFVGSGVGGILRYVLTGWVQDFTGEKFPTGTLAVNVVGCLAIGFVGAALAGPVLIKEEYRLAILVGFIGGFTTFSAFSKETIALASEREWMLAGVNLILSNTLGLAAVWIGTRLAHRVYGV